MTEPYGDLLQVSLYLTTPSNVPAYPGSVKPTAPVPPPASPR
jgi:hypothetical protein